MKIQATKKLLDQLPFKPVIDTEEEAHPIYAWHANLLTINRRKTVVLMNDSNRYVVVLHGLKAKDFKRFDEVVEEAIRLAFKAERVSDQVIEKYIEAAGSMTFHKTKNRSSVAQLNTACDHTWLYADKLNLSDVVNVQVGRKASRLLVGRGKEGMIYPYEKLLADLSFLVDGPILGTDAVVLNVSMELAAHSIWRKLIVPLDITLADFHQVLQVVFDWHDSHLHEYYVYDENEKHTRPKLNIVMHEESLEYGIPGVDMQMEEGLLLSDFVPKHMYMKYVYDFGDDWRHDIIVEEVLQNEAISSPICLAGEGTAPPEDCGGEFGFDTFLDVLSDATHPDYNDMKSWAEMQGYRAFDLDLVNRRLKYF